MKASELRKLYVASVRLYGYILSPQILDLLDHYKIEYNKKEILRDLKSRVGKFTRGYCVYQGRVNEYLVTSEFYNDEVINNLSKAKKGKPMYYPKTYEDFLKYSDYEYKDEKDVEAIANISRFLKSKFDKQPILIDLFTESLVHHLKHESFSLAMNSFEKYGYQFKSQKDVEKLLKVISKYSNNLRMPTNNGFTPNELHKIEGPLDPNNVMLTIGPNMKQNILDGKTDPYEMLAELENVDMPIMAKESLKKELLELIDVIEHKMNA